MTTVHVVSTGTANLASVLAALRRIGAAPVMVRDAATLRRAERLVLPGVGAFGAAMATLERDDLADPVREHVLRGKPFLAICLGMQLLAESSEESPGVHGLGVLPCTAVRLPSDVRVPQLGWNVVNWDSDAMPAGAAYFANSYCLDMAPPEWGTATSVHGMRFVAAIQRGAQLACQFHPELSGSYGTQLLNRWWATC